MIHVKLTNPSKITKKDTTLDSDSNVVLARSIYQNLGSLIKNTTILDDYNNDRLPQEYKRFLDEMNDLFIKLNYPELGKDIVVKEGIAETDEYLGDLGVIQEYFYSKDAVDIPAWVTTDSQSEYRILVDESDNTHLVDLSDDTVLVYYTK